MRFAISYAAQQVSGLWSWVKDKDHVEKAFDFAGMGARNGVTAVGMVQAGLTGVSDVLDGTHNLFIALSTESEAGSDARRTRQPLLRHRDGDQDLLGRLSDPVAARRVADAAQAVRPDAGQRAQHRRARFPPTPCGIVGDSAMPDVNCQHLVALALVKGAVSFADSHDVALMHDPAILAQRAKVSGDAGRRVDGPGRAAWRDRRGHADRRPQGRSLHQIPAGYEGKSVDVPKRSTRRRAT